MIKEMVLNGTAIKIDSYEEENVNSLHKITVDFQVTSDDYHDITTLLYKGTFDVEIPERELRFRGTIQQYSTSFTNLYQKGQVGDFHLCLLEMRE